MNTRRRFLCNLVNVGESFDATSTQLDNFIPHLRWTYPKPAITIQCPVNYHFLQRFTVGSRADNFVFISFEVDIFTGFDIHIKTSPSILK